MLNKKTLSIATGVVLLSIFSSGVYSAPFKPVLSADGVDLKDVKPDPKVKVGNEYEVAGVKYKPKSNDEYDVVGIASWYGEAFHGKLTANGEVYDMNELTAASPDLPMPSFVEVTNLDNGKKVVVRVNDRGPFAGGRTIDLSKRAAELLGFQDKGTTNVRVKLLKSITDEAVKELQLANNTKAVDSPNVVQQIKSESQPQEGVKKADVSAEDANNNLPANENIQLAKNMNQDEILSASSDQDMQSINLAEPNSVKSYVPRGVFVQIGAFNGSNNNIKQQVGNLSDVGVVSLQKVDLDGKNILRLRVGPYGSIDDAIKIKNRLVKLGYKDSRVIVEQ